MKRTWDLWVKGVMVLAVCPAMHFGVVGLGGVTEPSALDLQHAWDVTFDPDEAILVAEVDEDDEDFPNAIGPLTP